LAGLGQFLALGVELLVWLGVPLSPLRAASLPDTAVGVVSACLPAEDFKQRQSTTFPQTVTPVVFPIGNGRTSRNHRQVVAASMESSPTLSVQPDKHISIPKHAAFAACCEYVCVSHLNCLSASAHADVWCVVVASALRLGSINQPQLSVAAP